VGAGGEGKGVENNLTPLPSITEQQCQSTDWLQITEALLSLFIMK